LLFCSARKRVAQNSPAARRGPAVAGQRRHSRARAHTREEDASGDRDGIIAKSLGRSIPESWRGDSAAIHGMAMAMAVAPHHVPVPVPAGSFSDATTIRLLLHGRPPEYQYLHPVTISSLFSALPLNRHQFFRSFFFPSFFGID